MNLYPNPAAPLDLAQARAELRASATINHPETRRGALAAIQAAALLDIAESLRPIAAEAAAAMSDYVEGLGEIEDDIEPEPEPIRPGDLVVVEGLDDPAEVVGAGVDQDSAYFVVRLVDGSNEVRVWADSVTRLVGDEGDGGEPERREGVTLDDEGGLLRGDDFEPEGDIEVDEIDPTKTAGELAADLLDEIEPSDVVDDIDADFDGGQHPAAESAIDVLRANEAARKAAKKSGKKGSKK